ncbi:acyl-CoA dehydrogenase [Salsipaludibacter albus]|uniref:acyl-CoA dehydrogenase n=1 Tax=Salsipaludibacter albus TaxID=2849650 RepID=UPI001EE3C6F1|nr:acyl-CoA dehydrogenase [Salsipaludibacter albus]MBY5164436.1 acyl-CoA dehydrogenase [Salsipaludibacter albus]
MTDYTPPLRDIRFVLDHVVDLDRLATLDDYAHVDGDLVMGLLDEAGRFTASALAPANRDGDTIGATLHDGEVTTPDSWKKAYDDYVAAGWGALQHPAAYGGGDFPLVVANAFKEMMTAANMAFALGPLLTTGAVYAMLHHASDELQQTWLPRMVSGEWAGTMNLTEPQAGSDVGALTTRAERVEDGTYRITGQKIYITYGEHDLTDQIVHLVLARLPDAPEGTKGISLFLVPKFLLDEDGQPAERNDVTCVSIEHKVGIHASPTCVMAYGEDGDGAVGWLVGEEHDGMRAMFTMMNDARLQVGLQGLAIAERAHQQAADYARERRQGTAPGAERGTQSPIVDHPDVRRMLLDSKARIEAMRVLTYANAMAIDLADALDGDEAAHWQKVADLYTPLSKAWCTDLGVEVASTAIQVHGGMGYVEETGVAQHWRDARIAPIYEGTNGIQALDLVGRKLGYDGGEFVPSHLASLRDDVADDRDELASTMAGVAAGLDVLEETTTWLLEHRADLRDVFAGATPYLRLFATVVAGTLLARGASAALDQVEAGVDVDFHRAKLTTARYFAEQVVPEVHALAPRVTATARDLFALDPDQLG